MSRQLAANRTLVVLIEGALDETRRVAGIRRNPRREVGLPHMDDKEDSTTIAPVSAAAA
jgi:hypothetical protein